MLDAPVASPDRASVPMRRPLPRSALLFLALLLLSLLPRFAGLGEATTEDEDQWIGRTGGFARALATGAWRGTYQIGHPGVTTMWLTELSLGIDRARRFSGAERGDRQVTTLPDFLPALHTARVPFALASALLAALCG